MPYDLLVVGAGPAGLSAAIYARARNKSVLVVSNDPTASPLCKAHQIDNYPGIAHITGLQLVEDMLAQAREMGAEFRQGRVLTLMPLGDSVMASIGDQVEQAAAVVLAPGVARATPLPGEEKLLGRGVSYCATCDGMLYRGRPVVVAGRSKEAPRDAAYLKELGCQVVYVAPRRPEQLDPAIPFVQANRLEVEGEQTVTGLRADGALLPCSGIFILREAVAPTDLLPGLETENGAIRVDRRMATSIPGVFAAGDCTGEPLQVSKAVGEGLTAALSAAEYLDQLPKKDTAE